MGGAHTGMRAVCAPPISGALRRVPRSWQGSFCFALSARWGDAPIKVQQDRKKLAEGHFNISITKRVSLKNSTDLERVAATELKSVEFSSETLLVVE